ncbi:hypothetical protein PoMZ_05088 [Pyricularia oryzae]|uniref:non-specific serine/threonine protein kinase n=1 Tax=Pyricularia oryzae TaxID=318829 RepID=A0A4P7NMG4_PYROR|nr:hypothetical protein PoMZ_05088 [Pyricularia oryzae]
MAGKQNTQKGPALVRKQTNNGNANLPGRGPVPTLAIPKVAATGTTTHYEQIQEEELIALRAIYTDDFVELKDPHSAWKKSEPRFDIRIKAFSDEDVGVTLSVVMTATYPKSTPLLSFKDNENLSESTLFRLQKYLEREPKIFARKEEVMINSLVEDIREILEDAAQAKAQGRELPSLEEERAAHEAHLAHQAMEERKKEEQKRLEETQEEERIMSGQYEEEINRQRAKKLEIRRKNRSGHLSPDRSVDHDNEKIVFDQPCKLTDESGNELRFNTVKGMALVSTGPVCQVFTVRPVLSAGHHRPSLVLKQAKLKSGGKEAGLFKKQLQSLESQLESAKKYRHKNILEVMEFRIDSDVCSDVGSPDRTVSILTAYAKQGSLYDHMDVNGQDGQIGINRVRSWTRDLLDALNFLHTNGIVHKSIHPHNVLLFRDETGAIIPKLADAGFQKELHDICSSSRAVTALRDAKSAYWLPPEIAGTAKPHYTQKTDIWDFGVMFLQMVFGLEAPQRYQSPNDLKASLALSSEMLELVSSFFHSEPSRRRRAFDLGSHHFLAATSAQVLMDDADSSVFTADSVSSMPQHPVPRLRHGSMSRATAPQSRWATEWIEEGRLGKGGFGEVVKARNMVENVVYAVKKIRQRENESLTPIISEVSVFCRMGHPSVVKYVMAWIEDIFDGYEPSAGSVTASGVTDSESMSGPNIEFTTSGALDFVSSSRPPHIEFGFDSDNDDAHTEHGNEDGSDDSDESEESEAEDSDEESSEFEASGKMGRRSSRRPSMRPFSRKIMYLVMEYCEKSTLRDLIMNNLCDDSEEIWRLFRQILEGLQHIHGFNIIHRDLKPENIFIKVAPDGTNAVKIGDFGLATAEMRAIADKNGNGSPSRIDSGDMTRSVGTSTYLAPEVRSGSNGVYTTKCDMYALGIIFFEMCYPPMLGMQRAMVFDKLRQPPPTLPDDFRPGEKNQKQIVSSLVDHTPSQRPSATELLKSGLLPVGMESDAMRQVMAGLEDPNNPHYTDYISALFKRRLDRAKDYAWDAESVNKSPAELMRLLVTEETLTAVFRRHGAVKVSISPFYPPSAHYTQNTVEVVDKHGALLQLPYDLTMGSARALAKSTSRDTVVQRSYSFGRVFRDRPSGGQPQMFGEVHFDVVSEDASDLALKEAEAIKVLDEIIAEFPTLSRSQMCFHLGHSDLLRCIFDYCGVEKASRRAVADTLSKLNIRGVTWQKIKSELRTTASISTTTLDELQKFDFRENPGKAANQLRTIFQKTDVSQQVSQPLAHLKEVWEYCKKLGVRTKIYVAPLWSWNEVFFSGNMMFACLFDKRSREVLAAGGRYDSLIKEHRPRISGSHFQERHAVGFGMNWEQLAHVSAKSSKKRAGAADEETNLFATKRCDVLIASFDPSLLRTTGLELLQTLWAHGISAELARDARSPEEVLQAQREDGHNWVVIVKQDMLKIKTPGRREAPDADVLPGQLVQWLRAEMREREGRIVQASRLRATAGGDGNAAAVVGSYGGYSYHGRHNDYMAGPGIMSSGGGVISPGTDSLTVHPHREQEVRVITARTRSKKSNRQALVEQAQAAAARVASTMVRFASDANSTGPVVAIETTDAVMSLIQSTRLSDAESWRRAEQAVGMEERQYVRELRGLLQDMRADQGGVGRGISGLAWSMPAFVYNFRTGYCIYYDLGA